jgi:DNA-binding transcriptional LysR family regulator
MIDVRRLKLLQELRDRGTIAAVAEALHLTPSAVSQQLTRLSRDFQAPLLTRHGRQVRLTEQAHLLLEHAAVIDSQLAQARADLVAHGNGYAGRATLGAFASAIQALAGPVLATLARQRPGIRLRVEEIESPGCFGRLDAATLDVVVTVDYPGGPPRTDSRYHREDLLFDPLMLAVPAAHPLAAVSEVDLVVASGQPWIAGAGTGPCAQVVAGACAMAGFTPDVRHRVNEWTGVMTLVAAGAGVALVPRLALAHPPECVAVRPLSNPGAGRMIYAAVRAGTEHSPTLATVLGLLRERAASAERGTFRDRQAPAELTEPPPADRVPEGAA